MSPSGDGSSPSVRSRANFAAVASVLALAVALGGGTAFAATHYRITSVKQIKPSVVKKLQGHKGPKGAKGAPGKSGAVAGYFASVESTVVTNHAALAIVHKTLPAGSYIVHADISVFAQKGASAQAGSTIQCTLQGGSASQVQTFSSPYNGQDDNVAQGTLAFDVGTSSTASIAESLTCSDYSGLNGAQGGETGSVSVEGSITAVRTSANS